MNYSKPAANKRARRRRDGPKEIEDSVALAAMDGTFREEAALYLQKNDITLANTIRLAKAMNEVKNLRYTLPTPNTRVESRMNAILASDPIEGRDIYLHGVSAKEIGWTFDFDDNGKVQFLNGKTKAMNLPYSMLEETERDTAKKIGTEICRIFNMLPFPFFSNDAQSAHLVRSLAIENVNPAFGVNIRELTVSKTYGYGQTIRHFDPETGAALMFETTIIPSNDRMTGVSVPTLPSSLVISSAKDTPVARDPQGQLPYRDWKDQGKNKEPSSTLSQRVAQDLVRYIAMQCDGLVASKERMAEPVVYWQSLCNFVPTRGRREGGVGIYGHRALYSLATYKSRGITIVRLSITVHRDFSHQKATKKYDIIIASFNANRVTPVLDAMISTYSKSGDTRRGLLEVAKSAD